jgi:hypothetical protein
VVALGICIKKLVFRGWRISLPSQIEPELLSRDLSGLTSI